MGRIIVIEDNPVFRDHVCGMLEKAGYRTRTAYDCAGARRLLEELDDGDIIVSDLRLPDGECTEVLERMREAGVRNPFVIMTDYAQVASAVSSMRLGAEDYIPKTLLQEKLLPRISELVRKSERRHTMPILERRSAAFRTIDRRISLVAPTDIGVLILGENGTGKEHVAEKIHAQSTRQKGPFVAIDCGMLTRELAASELFGHEKGAFTGATTGKKGCMAEADGGTLFLDEVGNLPAEVQQKLLRALQTKCYRPTGCTRERKADVRIVAATNENLEKAVEEGRFRRDLYHRLKEFVIKIPPLRECREETGLTLTDYRYRGLVTFVNTEWPTEYMHLFTATDWTGEPHVCDEGDLAWIKKAELLTLPMWEGDKIFLRLLDSDEPFFSLKLCYAGDRLESAVLNGKQVEL